MKYEYHVIRHDGQPFTIQSDTDLFDNGWHKLANDYGLDWVFVQQWQNGKHLSTVHNV